MHVEKAVARSCVTSLTGQASVALYYHSNEHQAGCWVYCIRQQIKNQKIKTQKIKRQKIKNQRIKRQEKG